MTGGSGNTVSGVASLGAPLANANISFLSLTNGSIFESTSKTGADGSFAISINAGAYPGPYLVRVTGKLGDEVTSQYSYLNSNSFAGLVVSPISSAAVALSANRTADEAFSQKITFNQSLFMSKVEVIFKATKNVYDTLGVSDYSKLVSDSAYKADGKNADSALDLLSINYDGSLSGNLVIATKLSGKSVTLTNLSTTDDVDQLPMSTSLAPALVASVNANGSCVLDAIAGNNQSALSNCLAVGFTDNGVSSTVALIARWSKIAGKQITVRAANIKWCDFDSAGLSFESPASSLIGETGICLASIPLSISGGDALLFKGHFKFTIDAQGTGVADLKLYGNQLNTNLSLQPAIQNTIRIDGLSGNTGVTSGFKFKIDTKDNSGTVRVVAALIRLKDFSGTSISGGTKYMQCRQGGSCSDDSLMFCTDSNCSSFELASDGIFSVNQTLANALINSMKQGRVWAEVTAYSDIGRTSEYYKKNLPIVDIPMSQNIANASSFPTLDAGSIAALKNWSGNDTLKITYAAGDANLYELVLTIPSNNKVNTEKVSEESGTVVHSGISTSGIAALVDGCSTEGVYRSYNLFGSMSNISVNTKYFGSCVAADY